jgi:competence protein ComEA
MMNKMKRFLLFLSPVALVVPTYAQGLPDGEGRATYETVCGSCHGADIVVGSQGSRARWEETVDAMRNRGAYGSEDDFKVVVNYLARYFGPPVNVNTAAAKEIETEFGLTEAEAQALVKQRDAAPFKTFDDVIKVAGVPAAKLQPLKGRITF